MSEDRTNPWSCARSLLASFVIVASLFVPVAFAGTGTIVVSGNPPAVNSLQIDTFPASGANATNVLVDTWYLIKATISDPDKMKDIARVEVRLYKTSLGWPGSPTLDKERRWGLAWLVPPPTGAWEYLTPAGWGAVDSAYFDTSGSSNWGVGNPGVGTWTFKFKFDTTSLYTAGGGWTIQVRATDKSTNVAWRDYTFDIQLYVSITVPSTLSWTGAAGQANVTAASMPMVIQYKSNAVVKFRVSATDPQNSFGDSFSASNIVIDDDPDPGTDLRCQSLSNSLADWWTGLGVTSASGPYNTWWFVTIPVDQPTGTYTFTYTVDISFESYGT